jgi:hypothetical protein
LNLCVIYLAFRAEALNPRLYAGASLRGLKIKPSLKPVCKCLSQVRIELAQLSMLFRSGLAVALPQIDRAKTKPRLGLIGFDLERSPAHLVGVLTPLSSQYTSPNTSPR